MEPVSFLKVLGFIASLFANFFTRKQFNIDVNELLCVIEVKVKFEFGDDCGLGGTALGGTVSIDSPLVLPVHSVFAVQKAG